MPHTLPELRTQYLENADYDVTNDVAKARLFVVAVRQILLLQPEQGQTGGTGGELFQFDMKLLERQLQIALDFLRANDGGGFKFFDLTCFRE